MSGRVIGISTRLCVLGIVVGIFFMIQPWFFDLFRYGFLILLIATIGYTIVARFPATAGAAKPDGDSGDGLPVSVEQAEQAMAKGEGM